MRGQAFEARHRGTCAACDEAIKPGQQVRFDEDQLVHDDCAAAAPVERPVVVCDRCWLVKPCGCEDPS
jgi:hypothetical protein